MTLEELEELESRPLLSFVAVCDVDDCENQGLPLDLLSRDTEPAAFCGPCGTQITNLTQVSNE